MGTRDKRNTAIYTAFDDVDPTDIALPEKGLLRAILLNAIADMNREDEYSRRAREYFLSKEDDYIFSFQAVCSYLNVNPRHILILVGLEDMPSSKPQGISSDTGAVDGKLSETSRVTIKSVM